MNKKSMLDRDNIEFFMLSEEDDSNLIELIQELNDIHENDIKLQEWQEEILNKEINKED
jgi:hypothetical protein